MDERLLSTIVQSACCGIVCVCIPIVAYYANMDEVFELDDSRWTWALYPVAGVAFLAFAVLLYFGVIHLKK